MMERERSYRINAGLKFDQKHAITDPLGTLGLDVFVPFIG
jgi:hypothetical protein